jgi:hypothetical protein
MGLENVNPAIYNATMGYVKWLRKVRRNPPSPLSFPSNLPQESNEPEVIFNEEFRPDPDFRKRMLAGFLVKDLISKMEGHVLEDPDDAQRLFAAAMQPAASRPDDSSVDLLVSHAYADFVSGSAHMGDGDSPAARGPPRNPRYDDDDSPAARGPPRDPR